MKSAQLTAIGPAENVVKCIDVADPGAPGEGEILVDIVACSINPADILMIAECFVKKAVFFQDYAHLLPVESPEKVVDEIILFVNDLNTREKE